MLSTHPRFESVRPSEGARNYRPDIDGLRAVAVMAVVFYHAGVSQVPGGYVGVDVFFVISGFLITGIITREQDAGTFSLLRFYERRVRRIFPALFAMLAVVMGLAYAIFLPLDLQATAKVALAALASVSNIALYKKQGYFDEASITKPLLHTWSLAVEEQFYLVLPVILIGLLWWARQWRAAAVSALALISFVIVIVMTKQKPEFAFFLLPSRAWELLAGSLLVFIAPANSLPRHQRTAAAVAGIVLVLAAMILFDHDTRFPGPWAIVPVVGTMLVLHSAPNTFVGHVLSRTPIRLIGLVSYSLYLWHWPVIVFLAYLRQAPLAITDTLLALVLSFAMAVLSWRFIEQPFRNWRFPSLALWGSVIATSLGLAGFAFISAADGLPDRFSANAQRYFKSNNVSALSEFCDDQRDDRSTGLPHFVCKLGDMAAPAPLAIWSDSMGEQAAYAFTEIVRKHDQAVLRIMKPGCAPGISELRPEVPDCSDSNAQALNYLLSKPDVTDVVMTAYFGSDRYSSTADLVGSFSEAARILKASGKNVIIIGPMPQQPFDVSRALSISDKLGIASPSPIERRDYEGQNAPVIASLKQLATQSIVVEFPATLLCNEKSCAFEDDSAPYYIDDHHPSLHAARMIAGSIIPHMRMKIQAPQ